MHSEDQSKTAIWNNYLFKKNLGAFGPKSNFNKYASWILQGKEFSEDEFLEPWQIVSNILTSWAVRGDDPDLLVRNAIINLHNDRGMFEKSEEISVELIARHKGLESGAEKVNDLCFGAYFPQNKLEDAEKLLLEVLNWHNLSERIIGITHGNLGIIEYRRKNYSRAKEFFNLSLSADSTDSESLYYLGCISFHENDKSLATSFWNKCSSQTGRYPELAILKLAREQVTVIPEFTELARAVEFKDEN